MHKALLFNGIIFVTASASTVFLHGRQRRRELDEQRRNESKAAGDAVRVVTNSSDKV
jgi:hypothetical protein